MSSRLKLIGGGAILVAISIGIGAAAASGLGGDGGATHVAVVEQGPVALELADGPRADGFAAARGRATRKPVFTHLETTSSFAVEARTSTFLQLNCPARVGLPITGGVITDGNPEVAVSVLSRSNPNTGATPPRAFFVGVTNNSATPRAFRGTLVCAKRVDVR